MGNQVCSNEGPHPFPRGYDRENKLRGDPGVPVVPVSPGAAGAAGRRHQVSQVPHQRRMDNSPLHGSAKMVQIFETVNHELVLLQYTIQ